MTALPAYPMASGPLVSVCLPTYNGAAYVAEAVRSVVAQSYRPLELVVSDSGSQDSTVDAVRETAGTKIPLRIASHATPGMVSNWNACWRMACGRYVKFLFQDDALDDTCVARMVRAAERAGAAGLVYCRRRLVVEPMFESHPSVAWLRAWDGVQRSWAPRAAGSGVDGRRLLGRRDLLAGPANKVGEPSAVLVRRDVLDQVGPFNESMRQTVDAEMWLRIMASGARVAFVDEELVRFRVHPAQASVANLASGSTADDVALAATLSRPATYDLLHVSVRDVVRRRLAAVGHSVAPVTVKDRAFLATRGLWRYTRRLLDRARRVPAVGRTSEVAA